MARSDEELVTLVRQGDSAALGELYIRYGGSIYDYCFRLLNNQEEAEEAAQESFLRMYNSAYSLRNDTSVRAWLFSVARNLVLNSIRDRKKTEEATEDIAAQDENPYDITIRNEELDGLRKMVDALKPIFREMIVLREYEELSYAEIANVTREFVTVVKSRLFKARRALAEMYRKRYGREQP